MEWQKKQSAIQVIPELNKELSQLNTDQFKTMVWYKKNKHDTKLLTKKAKLIQRWEQTKHRDLPPASLVAHWVASDNEAENSIEEMDL